MLRFPRQPTRLFDVRFAFSSCIKRRPGSCTGHSERGYACSNGQRKPQRQKALATAASAEQQDRRTLSDDLGNEPSRVRRRCHLVFVLGIKARASRRLRTATVSDRRIKGRTAERLCCGPGWLVIRGQGAPAVIGIRNERGDRRNVT